MVPKGYLDVLHSEGNVHKSEAMGYHGIAWATNLEILQLARSIQVWGPAPGSAEAVQFARGEGLRLPDLHGPQIPQNQLNDYITSSWSLSP